MHIRLLTRAILFAVVGSVSTAAVPATKLYLVSGRKLSERCSSE
jgi:hypothetical protein